MIMNQKIIKEKNIYRTADLALATTISLSYPLESIDRHNSRKAYFCFERKNGIDELIENYWRGELKVEPQSYFNQLRIIKARLYANNEY